METELLSFTNALRPNGRLYSTRIDELLARNMLKENLVVMHAFEYILLFACFYFFDLAMILDFSLEIFSILENTCTLYFLD